MVNVDKDVFLIVVIRLNLLFRLYIGMYVFLIVVIRLTLLLLL